MNGRVGEGVGKSGDGDNGGWKLLEEMQRGLGSAEAVDDVVESESIDGESDEGEDAEVDSALESKVGKRVLLWASGKESSLKKIMVEVRGGDDLSEEAERELSKYGSREECAQALGEEVENLNRWAEAAWNASEELSATENKGKTLEQVLQMQAARKAEELEQKRGQLSELRAKMFEQERSDLEGAAELVRRYKAEKAHEKQKVENGDLAAGERVANEEVVADEVVRQDEEIVLMDEPVREGEAAAQKEPQKEREAVSPEVVKAEEADRGRALVGLLDAVRPTIDQLMETCRGSHWAEQTIGTLASLNRQMIELSAQYASVGKLEKEFSEIMDLLANCKATLEEDFGYSEQAVAAVHDWARALPANVQGSIVYLCQQIENGYGMAKGVLRREGKENIVVPIDKRVRDESELRALPDEHGIVHKDYGSISSVM